MDFEIKYTRIYKAPYDQFKPAEKVVLDPL